MPELSDHLRDLFKLDGQTLTAEQHLIYATAYADAIRALAPKDDPQQLVSSLRARAQQIGDIADLVEQYMVAAGGKMTDADDEDEEEEPEGKDDEEEEGKEEGSGKPEDKTEDKPENKKKE